MTLSRILRAKMSVGSTRVRVAGGDLCRRWSAEAPTEPAGETGALPRYLRITPHQRRPLAVPKILSLLIATQNFDRCANKSSLHPPPAAVGCVAFEKGTLNPA